MNVDEGTPNSQTSETNDQTQTDQSQNQTDQSQTDQQQTDQQSLVDGGKKDDDQSQQQTEFVPLTAEDITFPEGLEISDERRDEALSIINNRELSPKEQLQALVDLQGKLAKEASDTISGSWASTQKEWQDAVKADPTIGGDKLPATLAAVNKLVSEYGSPELVEAFALTGAGNNVHVIKFLNTVAGKLLEGGLVPGGSPTNQAGDAASRMFPSMKG